MKHSVALTAVAALATLTSSSISDAAPPPGAIGRPLPALPYAAPVYPWGINAGVYPFGYSGYGAYPGYRSGGISIGIGIGVGSYPRSYGGYSNPGWPYGYPSSYRSIFDQRIPAAATFPDFPRALVVPLRAPETLPMPAAVNSVILTIQAPTDDSEVLIDGAPTNARGPSRRFESPELERGHNYAYEVTARWMENGKPQERKRSVTVRAGDRTTVDMRQPQ